MALEMRTTDGGATLTGMRVMMGSRALAVGGAIIAAIAVTPAPVDGGPGVWASPTLTVRVADRAAWSGTDVEAALEQWAPAMRMTLTDGRADITLDAAPATGELVGATAYRDTEAGVIRSCRVDLSEDQGGRDMTAPLTHELGHCLGLRHTDVGSDVPTVMWRASYGPHFSPAVTPTDLDAVRALYR